MYLDDLDSIDQDTFNDLLEPLNRAKDKIGVSMDVHNLIVEFLTYKVYDEKKSKKLKRPVKFYITKNEEDSNEINQFRKRMDELQKKAKEDYPNILNNPLFGYRIEDDIYRPNHKNAEKFLIELVKVFEYKSIIKSQNGSFNQIVFSNFASSVNKAIDKQFFTPIPVVNTIVNMINPHPEELICDPCSGICDFLAMSFRKMYEDENLLTPIEQAQNLYGFDKDQKVLKLAELNLVLNGDGGANVYHLDSISQKLADDNTILEEGLFTEDNYDINWNPTGQSPSLKKFNIILTNPPFGKDRDITLGKEGKWDYPEKVIKLYETYWRKKSIVYNDSDEFISHNELLNNYKIKHDKSMDMGAIFLENAVKLLEEGGRMAIILSNSIASIDEWAKVRAWFFSKMRLVASLDLPSDTFTETGVSTTVLIAYKPKNKSILENNYSVYVNEIKNLGYEVKTEGRIVSDSNPVYVIDRETFEPLLDSEGNKVLKEDFSEAEEKFDNWVLKQEEQLKEAFNVGK